MQSDTFYAPNYTLLRTLSTQVAESTPTAGTFATTLINAPYYDVVIAGTAMAGTVTADQVIFEVWGLYTTTVGTQIVNKLDTITVDAANITTAQVRQVRAGTSQIWVTCRFNGGTTPNCSAVIYVRAAWSNLLTKSDFTFDSNNNLVASPLSYDGAANADRTIALNDVSDKYSYEIPVDITGTTLATSNYDIDLRGYSGCTIHMSATSGTAGSLKFRFESIADITSASPLSVPVTVSGFNANSNSFLAPDYATQDITVSTVNTKYRIDYPDFGACILRIVTTVSSHASNVLKIVVAKKF